MSNGRDVGGMDGRVAEVVVGFGVGALQAARRLSNRNNETADLMLINNSYQALDIGMDDFHSI